MVGSRKQDSFAGIDPAEVLDMVVSLPIKAQDASIRHIGSTAQVLSCCVWARRCSTGINIVDAHGVALAAIRGLNAKLEAKIAEQARKIAELRGTHERLTPSSGPIPCRSRFRRQNADDLLRGEG